MLDAVKRHSGLSQYELGKHLSWNNGRVDGSIRRLINEGKIVIKVGERKGRHVNLVYPKETKPSNIIEIPTELLQVGNPTWSNSAYVYALDNSTIGVSGKEMEEWNEIAGFKDGISLKHEEKTISFEIPEKFNRFYDIEQRHKVVSVNGNAILITISGNLVVNKKYPS